MTITDTGGIVLPDSYRDGPQVLPFEPGPMVADFLWPGLPGADIRRRAVRSAMTGRNPAARDSLYLAVHHRWAEDPLEVVEANLMATRAVLYHLEALGTFVPSELEAGMIAYAIADDTTLRRLWSGQIKARSGTPGTIRWFDIRFREVAVPAFAGPATARLAARLR